MIKTQTSGTSEHLFLGFLFSPGENKRITCRKQFNTTLMFQVIPGDSRPCSHLSVLQGPQVQQVNVARQRRAERQEGSELRQLAVARGDHCDWRVAEKERGQVSKQ